MNPFISPVVSKVLVWRAVPYFLPAVLIAQVGSRGQHSILPKEIDPFIGVYITALVMVHGWVVSRVSRLHLNGVGTTYLLGTALFVEARLSALSFTYCFNVGQLTTVFKYVALGVCVFI